MSGKTDAPRQGQYGARCKRLYDEGWEIAYGGWMLMGENPPGTPHEVRRMGGRLYWRLLQEGVDDGE